MGFETLLRNSSNDIEISFETYSEEHIQSYTINFTSGIDNIVKAYTIKYTSVFLEEEVDRYSFYNTYQYDDTVVRYRIRYNSGREVLNYTSRYTIKYSSQNIRAYTVPYKIVFHSEVIPTNVVTPYTIKYTSEYLIEQKVNYYIRYSTIGVESTQHRKRYNITYTTNSLGEFSTTYKIKFTRATFYENSTKYVIRYNTEGSKKVLTRASVLTNNNGINDLLLEIKGLEEENIDNYLFVLSNLPKYQLVEFVTGEELPYITYYPYYELQNNAVFTEENLNAYTILGYLLIKNIDINNPISVDIYDSTEDYMSINRAKSYFFSTEDNAFTPITQIIGIESYVSKNMSSYHYDYNYLNFTEVKVDTRFNIASNCCFSKKITRPGEVSGGGACSPF